MQPTELPTCRAVIIWAVSTVAAAALAIGIGAAVQPRGAPWPESGWVLPSTQRSSASGRIYQGRTLDQWAERLHTISPQAAKEAALAIATYGAEGVPVLLEGMRSPHWHNRFEAIMAFPVEQAAAYPTPLRNALQQMLNDPDSNVRVAAGLLWSRAGLRGLD